ncbi:MAG: MBL fold metallo-hydrolase [Bacteroidales bacterium]|nr:MBL fold metallo-hydrolase [Bacteroidales bacterium]MCL2133772.1 MBL fold metallo-hydrolase [Bacteroidales bacterium]
MKLTFLGTGTSQGVPVIACDCKVCRSADTHDKRLRASALLEVDGKVLLIDAGPDFRQQLLRAEVKRLDAILLTHEHKDHTAGLDDVRAFNYITRRPMDIYAEARVLEAIKQEYKYVFAEYKYPGSPEMALHVIDNQSFEIAGVCIEPVRVWHYRLPVFGFKIGALAYITDAKTIDDKEREKLKGLDVLVVNAVKHGTHISHFSLEEALTFINEMKPRRAYITHISHRLEQYAELQLRLPQNVFLAYDGLIVNLSQ